MPDLTNTGNLKNTTIPDLVESDLKGNCWRLNYTLDLLWQRISALAAAISKLSGGGKSGPFKATLDVKDTTVGNNIADVVPVAFNGSGIRIFAVLRIAIASDLTVRINKGPDVMTMTIPSATAPFVLLTQLINGVAFLDSQVITWDILASDGSKAADGVATFLVEWQ